MLAPVTHSGADTNIFTEITSLATRTGAVNLGQGFPDRDGPPAMLAAAQEAIAAGRNQYPPLAGIPELRNAIADQRAARYGASYDPESEVLVTAGATEAVAATLLALTGPGREVVTFEPAYDSYPASVARAGAGLRLVPMRPDAGGRFCFDPADLRAAITPHTTVLLLNSPHNPTGTVFNEDELAVIADCCQRHDLIAVTDEVYEYLVYDGSQHLPLAGLPGMRERTLAISSAGKTFSATGWKVGWVCGPSSLIAAVRRVKQYLTFASGTPFQVAVAMALDTEQAWVRQLTRELQARREQLAAGVRRAGLSLFSCQGAYFLQADIRPLGLTDGASFCRALAERVGVAAIPSAAFYRDPAAPLPYVRFAFCKQPEVIAEATRRLERLSTFPLQEALL